MIYKKSKQGFANIVLVVVLVIVIISAGAGYLIVKKPKPETLKLTPTPAATSTTISTPTSTSDETADWKTYRNEEYGFEIKYPSNWNVSTGTVYKGIEVEFRNQDARISIQSGSRYNPQSGKNYPLEYWTDLYRNAFIRNKVEFMEKKLIFAEREGVEFSYKVISDGSTILYREIFVVNETSMYRIIINFDSIKKDIYNPTIDKILSTFRFIE